MRASAVTLKSTHRIKFFCSLSEEEASSSELAKEEKREIEVKELRKHIAWYTKNLKNSSEFRNSVNKIESKEELIEKLDEYFQTL